MTANTLKNNKGFVMLFAVTISSILLSIALGVINISLNEVRFSTSARDTNDAFFAADVGAECALLFDNSDPDLNAFTGTADIRCNKTNITLNGSDPSWNFVFTGLGSLGQSCAKVTVVKNFIDPYTFTTITSKGYNIGDVNCDSTSSNRVERELKLSY
jgi:Tfp pilus assembly protein PilX